MNFWIESVLRSIKILDIGWAATVYFVGALLCVKILNINTRPSDYDMDNQKSTTRLCAEVILQVWFIGVLAYIFRNLFGIIPWPFQGVYGYDHLQVKEVTNSAVFVAFMVIFDTKLQNKVKILKSRLFIM